MKRKKTYSEMDHPKYCVEERRKYKHWTDVEGQLIYRNLRNYIKKTKEELLEQQCSEINDLYRVYRTNRL